MPADYRTVRLMKNRLYPTYQLHAVMAARKTTPEDGLKIGVLTILDWLRHRLGSGCSRDAHSAAARAVCRLFMGKSALIIHKSRLCHRHCFAAGAGSMDDADRRA